MKFTEILEKLGQHENLTTEEAAFALKSIIDGEINHAQTAAFLYGMKSKIETVEELAAFVQVMRDAAVDVNVNTENAVDLCGTGGDHSGTFNISTATMFVVAGANVPVLKHGNRNVSSNSGSADVLEKLGANSALSKEQVEECYNETGMAFMFAPNFHPAMKNVMPARKELGMRTFFNMLGPLLNPANVKRQVIGTYSREVAQQLIAILAQLDTEFAYGVHAHDGMDEFSTASFTDVIELQGNKFGEFQKLDPRTFGFSMVDAKDLQGGDSETNAEIIKAILEGEGTEAQEEIVALNATFTIYASGLYDDLQEAHMLAMETLESGEGAEALKKFVECTQDLAQKEKDSA